MRIVVRIGGLVIGIPPDRATLADVRWQACTRGPGGSVVAHHGATPDAARREAVAYCLEQLARAIRAGHPRVAPLEPIEWELVDEGVTSASGTVITATCEEMLSRVSNRAQPGE